jgi:GTPase
VLLHVLDIASDGAEDRYKAVEAILGELDVKDIPRVIALNKVDRADPFDLENATDRWNGVPISAARGEGLDRLKTVLLETLEKRRGSVTRMINELEIAFSAD